jgi:hypothetical protein
VLPAPELNLRPQGQSARPERWSAAGQRGLTKRSPPHPVRSRAVEPDGDRAVIGEVDGHVGAEAAGRDRRAGVAQAGAEMVLEARSDLRRCGAEEARAVALAQVVGERRSRRRPSACDGHGRGAWPARPR